MSTTLTPVSVLDDAIAKACAAAKAMLPLIGTTLHSQFPNGAYLVLTRPVDYDTDYDSVRLNSVRDAGGNVLHEFDEWAADRPLLPAVPEEIAALWGGADPRNPSEVLNLIQRVDEVEPYQFLAFLPTELRTAEEIAAEDEGGRTPLGIPLAPAD
ncbi:hypothetical protein SSP531S_58680 [Streptomyces spongiicola]|uniref:Uncharacterized protein n=1 Tax=Streptomyces spongiicola TaxID=1690221 RepID=A0A388T7U2_9ACTN|nr:hypothetical protein [Streptomyces spongiicola]GBQ04374.1 hypothetical protein SSP531S_58680 [Streptomyces spongiicola]